MEDRPALARLREFESLFGHRWDALAMLCLAASDAPLRYRALASEMNRHSDELLSDTDLSRCLHRLADAGLLRRLDRDGRHSPYALTAAGQRTAGRLDSVLTAVSEFAPSPRRDGARPPVGSTRPPASPSAAQQAD